MEIIMSVKPITPSQAEKLKSSSIPDAVIEAFNELIAEKLNGRHATVMQKEAVRRIKTKMKVTNDELFYNGWMDVEPIFRKAGWKVTYDKPAYNESYEPSFQFSK